MAEVAAYAETDLVCYRTDEPPALARRQAAAWQPLVAWAAGSLRRPPCGHDLGYPHLTDAGRASRAS